MDKTKRERYPLLLSAVLWGMIVFMSVLFLVSGKREFSEGENRYLARFPELSLKSVKSGAFMSGLNEWLCDQFPFRDGFMTIRTEAERLSGVREINGVYLAADGTLIDSYAVPKNTEKIIRQFSKLKAAADGTDTGLRLMLVPTAVSVRRNALPGHSVSAMEAFQEDTIRRISEETGIGTVPVRERLLDAERSVGAGEDPFAGALPAEAAAALSEPGRILYYGTDHHWTTLGAYTAYTAWCDSCGIVPTPLSDYEAEIVTEDFRGTTWSKLNDRGIAPDRILLFRDPSAKLSVHYMDTGAVTDSLYGLERLSGKDKYSMFLDGLHPYIEVTNEGAESTGELLLVKDSYANSMVPFLTRHFRKIHIIDTRYYKQGPGSILKSRPEITDALILYNMNTIDTDLGIGGIF